jgi:hypothetical protein
MFKLNDEYESELGTFLIYLNRLPEDMISNVKVDTQIANALRKI